MHPPISGSLLLSVLGSRGSRGAFVLFFSAVHYRGTNVFAFDLGYACHSFRSQACDCCGRSHSTASHDLTEQETTNGHIRVKRNEMTNWRNLFVFLSHWKKAIENCNANNPHSEGYSAEGICHWSVINVAVTILLCSARYWKKVQMYIIWRIVIMVGLCNKKQTNKKKNAEKHLEKTSANSPGKVRSMKFHDTSQTFRLPLTQLATLRMFQ